MLYGWRWRDLMDPEVLSSHVENYLQRAGWTKSPPGPMGAVWRGRTDDQIIAVPYSLRPDTTEWRGLISRLAAYERRSVTDVSAALSGHFVDIVRVRAANDLLIADSIPFSAGFRLVSTARVLLRSCATTAQRQRAQIGGNYSKVADDIADQARIGHTEKGSYVIPILMPLPPQSNEPGSFADHDETFERTPYEPAERRVVRTMAEALTAVEQRIIEPAVEPRASDIPSLVAAGVSRELVTSLEYLLTDGSVAFFSASFDWANELPAPAHAPRKISMPAEASELLTKTARLLKSRRREPNQVVTGPIVEVRYIPDDPFGEIAIQTVRHGRPAEVRVRFPANMNDEMHEWMRTRRTVIAEGVIEQSPGRQSTIAAPTDISPLDTRFLPSI